MRSEIPHHNMVCEFKIYSFIHKDLVNVIGTKITILINSYIHFDYFFFLLIKLIRFNRLIGWFTGYQTIV